MMQEVQNEREFVPGNYEKEIKDGLDKCKYYTEELEERININIS